MIPMRLTVIGCAGSYPGPESATSCYLVEADEPDGRTWRILLDLGSGALGPLHRFTDPFGIDAVFISHLHADHCLDLCGYHVLRRYHPDGAQPRIPVWGPVGTAQRMAQAYGLPEAIGMNDEFAFYEHGAPVHLGPFVVEPVPVKHPIPTFGLRVSANGRTLAYSGDTGPCAGLDQVADGADLLLAEAAFQSREDNPPDLHLTGADCGVAARAVGWAASWSPTCRPGTTRRSPWPRRRPTSPARSTWPPRAPSTTSELSID
jgi:ribonuclease BN (tRNA processing enzyme)